MSAEIDDGGPAFPHGEIVQDMLDEKGRFVGNRVGQPHSGMTLRDWFAGQALAGNLAYPNVDLDPCQAARMSYKYADAMIAARKGGTDGNR